MFFAARRDRHSRHKFRYAKFNCDQGGLIVPLITDIYSDLDIVGRYEVIRNVSFDPVLSILRLRRSSEVDYGCYDHL